MRKRYFALLKKDLQRFRYVKLADMIGIGLSVLWKVVNGKSAGSISTWDKIFKFYEKQR
jgi:predicted transcriptional regulator